MNGDTVIVPEEDRRLVLVEEEFVIEIPGEWRWVEVQDDASG